MFNISTTVALAGIENENEVSFEAFISFTKYLNAKLKILEMIYERE